jgi:hypothetical protein
MEEDDALPDIDDVPVSGGRVLVAGLALAAGAMLVAEMFIVLVLRMPEFLLIAAPLTVAFVITAGIPVALAVNRLTPGMGIRRASLTFGAAGLVAGTLWGYPVFTIALNTAGESAGIEPGTGAAIVGAVYVGSLAALGGICGRYFGPWAATRPSLVRTAVGAVLAVAVLGFVLLSVIRLEPMS